MNKTLIIAALISGLGICTLPSCGQSYSDTSEDSSAVDSSAFEEYDIPPVDSIAYAADSIIDSIDSTGAMMDEDEAAWSTESSAWEKAKEIGRSSAYKRYMDKYPRGKHYAQAKKKYIDLSVSEDSSSDHGTMPQMEQTSWSKGKRTTIKVTNSTSYTLTILYSGAQSDLLELAPHATRSIRLKNGTYKISARIKEGSSVRPYIGTEELNGGSYSSEYYISSSPF